MARHAAPNTRRTRRALVAGALPLAIAAAGTGTAHAQDTGSATLPALPELPQVELPPLYNPYDLNARPYNVLQPGYAPTPEQRIADYTDTGRLLGAQAGVMAGGSLAAIPVGAVGLGIMFAGSPATWFATIGPVFAATLGATVVGIAAGGSVGADLGADAGADLAHRHNAGGAPAPLS